MAAENPRLDISTKVDGIRAPQGASLEVESRGLPTVGEKHQVFPEVGPVRSGTEIATRKIEGITGRLFKEEAWKINDRVVPFSEVGVTAVADPERSLGTPDQPELSFFAGIYGTRVVDYKDGLVQVQTVPVVDLPKIHTAIADEVLTGEQTRIAIPTNSLEPEAGTESVRNNNQWLEVIAGGGWPIMNDIRHTTEFNPHDYADTHLGNVVLYPKEIQEMLSEAAVHELAYREKSLNDESVSGELLLPGETINQKDPYSISGLYTDGITKIDAFTDDPGYMPLIAQLVASEEDPEVIIASMQQQPFDPSKSQLYARGSVFTNTLMRSIGTIANYNMRHREGRNIDPEEARLAYVSALAGIARIARKLKAA